MAIPPCSGYAYDLTAYKLSAGTPTGSTLEIIPDMEITGPNTHTTESGTTTTTFDYAIQITAFALA